MTRRIPLPRLLPVTICVIAVVLAARVTVLVQTLIHIAQPSALVPAAWAAGSEPPAPTSKPTEKADARAAPDADKAAANDGIAPVSDGERAVLMDLRQRRQELEAREASLTARESMLTAAEGKLSERVTELQGLQKKLESLDASHRQQEDAAWQGLVKVYETMKPRDAATIFNDLGMQVLLAVVDRMKEAKAAAILAAMEPDKAREVTMRLARSRSGGAIGADTGGTASQPPQEPTKAPGSGT